MHEFISRAYLLKDLNGAAANALSARQTHSEYLEPFAAVNLANLEPARQELLVDRQAYTDFYQLEGQLREAKLNRALSHLRLWQQVYYDPAVADNSWILVVESGVSLAHDWLRRARLIAEQLHATDLQAISLTNDNIDDFAAHEQDLEEVAVFHNHNYVYTINDPVNHLLASAQLPVAPQVSEQKVYATRTIQMTGSGAYLIRKSALSKIIARTLDITEVITCSPERLAQLQQQAKTPISWNAESWHEVFRYRQNTHAYAVPVLGVEVFNPVSAQSSFTPEAVVKNLVTYSQWQLNALSVEQAKEQLHTLEQHQAQLNPEQQMLLSQAANLAKPAITGDSYLQGMGSNFLQKVRKYLLTDPGYYSWQTQDFSSRFFAQEGTSDFRIQRLPQNTDEQYLKFLNFHRLSFAPLKVPHHLPLNEYRYNYAWGQLIAQVLTDPTLSDNDWIMVCEDNQLFTPDWQRKLNHYLEVLLTSQVQASYLILANHQAKDFRRLERKTLEELKIIPAEQELTWSSSRLEPLHLLGASQALAQISYQKEQQLALTYSDHKKVTNTLANFSSTDDKLYLAANEQLGGSLNLPPELQEAVGVPKEQLSAELAKLVDLYWQITDIDVTLLKPQTFKLGQQEITRPFFDLSLEEQAYPLAQNGVENFKHLANVQDFAQIKARVANFSQDNTQQASPSFVKFYQQINQAFTSHKRDHNQANLNRELLRDYAQGFQAQPSYLFTSQNPLASTKKEINAVWPTALSLDQGNYLVSDWQPQAYQALDLNYYYHHRYPNVMLNVGALRRKAAQQAFNPYRINAKSLVNLIDFNVGTTFYANPGFSITNSLITKASEQALQKVFDPLRPHSQNSRLLLNRNLQQQHLDSTQDQVSSLPAFLINLEKDKERLHRMELQVGSEFFKVVKAVYGRDYSDEQLEQMFDIQRYEQETNKLATPSEIGCTLSHCKIYLEILEDPNIDDQDWVLITEDDCLFAPQWRERLNEMLSYLRTPYAQDLSIVFLGHTYFKNFKLQSNQEFSNTTYLYPDNTFALYVSGQQKLHPLVGFLPAASFCYLIRKGALRTHAQDFKRPFWVADHFTYFVPFTPSAYAMANPPLTIHNLDLESNIAEDRAHAEITMRTKLKQVPIGWHEVRDFLKQNKFVLQTSLTTAEIEEKFPGFTIIPPFDYHSLSEQEFNARYDRQGFIEHYGYEPSDEDINRALQHQEVYRLLADQALNIFEFALIVEDNVVINPNIDLVKYANLYLKYVDTRLILQHRLVSFSNLYNPHPFIPLTAEEEEASYIYRHNEPGTLCPGYSLIEVKAKTTTGASAYMVINLNIIADQAHSRRVSWLYDDFPRIFNFRLGNFSYSNPCLVATPEQNLATEKDEV
ncbi:glycosyltransferase family 25 protein [Psittacicella gerlachiana]|uniref:Glycosyl transferase family 25 domain-containing protein n=1 Tax=Psittacicella gerlachiana TaxID=2028574 RepID=A0A3A1YGW5_9GAMM|nr:glycosyltransferase family 25 protein [Psittacicella gerlachiana]RIY36438.1 hypothetical protein CKF59_02730 [Psittacicella gerlachiana]